MKRKTKKPKTLRKPKPLRVTPGDEGHYGVGFTVITPPDDMCNLKPRQARKLANWLIRAANYLDAQ